MKTVSVLLVVVLGFSVASAQDDLQRVIHEREGVLKQLVELTEARHKTGAASQAEVFEAWTKLLKFKVGVAVDPAEKISLQEKVVKMAEENQAYVTRLFESGTVVRSEVLLAQDRTLEEKQVLLTLRAGKP